MSIDDRLQDAARRAREKARLTNNLKTTNAMITRCGEDLEKARKRLVSEQKDVERLDGKNLVSLWHGIKGTTDQAKRKEQEEYLEAKLKLDEAQASLAGLLQNLNQTKRELTALGDPDEDYRIALRDKETYLLQTGGDAAEQLLEIASETGVAQDREKELREAVDAGQKADKALARAEESLGKASDWGVVDILGGGLLTTAIKHSNINDAQEAIRRSQSLLRRFQQELSDVQKDLQVDMGAFVSLADYFFDGLIVDIFVQSKVNDARGRTRDLRRRVNELLQELEQLRNQNQSRLEQLSAAKAGILESGHQLP